MFAVHYAAGVISEVVTCPEEGSSPVLGMQPGFSMTEIELPAGLAVAENLETDHQGLTELVENFRVVAEPGKAALVQAGDRPRASEPR